MNGVLEQRWAQIAGVALIALTSFVVLRPFFAPIAWAAILAYASWPLHVRIDRVVRGRLGLSAFAMTALMILVVVVPAVLVTTALVIGSGAAMGPRPHGSRRRDRRDHRGGAWGAWPSTRSSPS